MSDARKAVFLSYASQDAQAARLVCDALRAAGIEVWFDQSELRGGDAWDAKIRKQIKECALFVPIISANTQARPEGYFRLEWKLAVDRSQLMADDQPFFVPVVIDDTPEASARVPDKFRDVQWTRLVLTETPTAFAERMRGLLSNEMEPGRPHGGLRAESAASPNKSVPSIWWTKIVPLAGIAVGLVFALKPLWPTRRAEPGPRPRAAAVAPSIVPRSESREFAEKARGLFQALEATREDFALAEDWCQRALKLDSADAEVWAAYSQLNAAFGYRGWDRSLERKEQTRIMAERAIRLAPDSAQAQLAQAGAWSAFGINRTETEKLLRDVLARRPNDQVVLRYLASVVLSRGEIAESLALNQRSAALPGGDPLALYNNARALWARNRAAEAYAALQAALGQKQFSSGLVLKMVFDVSWRGDLAGAEAALKQLPEALLLEDRANFHAGLLRFIQRRPEEAIAIWSRFPRESYDDFQYAGPKGFLLGLAHELAGRADAAHIEWRSAVQVIERRLAATPNHALSLYFKAFLLACLGDPAAAETLRIHEQLAGVTFSPETPMGPASALIYVRLGRIEQVMAQLPVSLAHSGQSGMWPARLRLDPRYDGLRKDPRFVALLEQYPLPGAETK